MPRLKRQTYYVICAGPDPRADPGLRWMSRAGAVTTLRSNAVRFVTVTDATFCADARHCPRWGHALYC